MEAVEAGRAGLGQSPWGTRPARLAHRMLGDGRRHLGETFDIHGGGIDLVFPHHENEIAQIALRLPRPARWRNYWMHNGFLQVEGEKMSKSLGNFVTIHELLNARLAGRGAAASTCCRRITASRSTGRLTGLREAQKNSAIIGMR